MYSWYQFFMVVSHHVSLCESNPITDLYYLIALRYQFYELVMPDRDKVYHLLLERLNWGLDLIPFAAKQVFL